MGVHRDLRMRMRAEHLRAFFADRPVAQRGALGRTAHDPDLERCCHAPILQIPASRIFAPKIKLRYCSLRILMGSMRAARYAGKLLATKLTTNSSIAVAASVSGSVGCT